MGDKIVCSNGKPLANTRFDFDILMTTNNEQLTNGAFGGLPVTYDKHPIKKETINKKFLYKYDERAFDSKIGFITNVSTSLYTMLNNFEEDTEEYRRIIDRLKILRKEQGNAIDAAKGASPKPFPSWWTKNDSEIDFSQDEEKMNRKIMITKRPYFMRYLYGDYNKKYVKHCENFDIYCISKYGYDVDELKNKKYQTEETIKAIENFYTMSPLIDNDSTMNLICHYMEEQVQEIKGYRSNNFEYYKLMMDNNISIDFNSPIIENIYSYYNNYIKIRTKDFDDLENKERCNIYAFDISSLKEMMYKNLSSNENELCNATILLTYVLHKNYKKEFAWDLFSNAIIQNIINNTEGIAYMPMCDNNGDIEYLFNKYRLTPLDLKNKEDDSE